jgi:hypothetical protein
MIVARMAGYAIAVALQQSMGNEKVFTTGLPSFTMHHFEHESGQMMTNVHENLDCRTVQACAPFAFPVSKRCRSRRSPVAIGT